MNDIPNFAAWSNADLAQFAVEAYLRMQELAYDLEQERLNSKGALEMARKLLVEKDNDHRN
jgi:hypothetical protein